ncbi:unnamed protein product [Boreogadus saida]
MPGEDPLFRQLPAGDTGDGGRHSSLGVLKLSVWTVRFSGQCFRHSVCTVLTNLKENGRPADMGAVISRWKTKPTTVEKLENLDKPITAQNNLYVTVLLLPGTVLSTPAYKYLKITDFWSEEREENLICFLEEQPVLYDVGSKRYSNRASKKKACCDIAVALGVVF